MKQWQPFIPIARQRSTTHPPETSIAKDSAATVTGLGRAGCHLRPVHERLLAKLKSSPKLFADETTAPVRDPGRGKTKIGHLWDVCPRRSAQVADPPGVAYVYAPDRKAERPIAPLAGFAGIPQV
ncbi:transposase, partial [Mesorhizobium sp.]|uniref:IS66 family transposase n=1 Tax=Mesorhizobium sp. TaxID=1871066 RepID=UPI0025D1D35E